MLLSFSRASVTLQPAQLLQTNRPGTHRRVDLQPILLERCSVDPYVCGPVNKSCTAPVWRQLSVLPDLMASRPLSVEMTGFEPVAFALQRRCSPAELHPQDLPWLGVGLTGFEPVTPVLSGLCSNQLSYKPRVRTLATEK
jgi:hypothetical protein